MTAPIVSWYETENNVANEIVDIVRYGTVDADTDSEQKVFYVFNNRNGSEDVSKMEEVTLTTRDRLGGTGDTPGNIVESVRDNWFQTRVDSLEETSFTPIGRGGVGTDNPSGAKALGTTGATINPNAKTATEWEGSTPYTEGQYIKPLSDNGFIYKVTVAGTTSGNEPTWVTIEGNVVVDGTVEYVAVKISKTPAAQEILGVQNSVLQDGSNADEAGGNFVKFTMFAEVPQNASSGKQLLMKRLSFRYV